MNPCAIPRYLDKQAREALEELNAREYSRLVSSLPENKKRQAWRAFWDRAIAFGTAADLDKLEYLAASYAPVNAARTLNIAIARNNTSTLGWLLSCKDFLPCQGLRKGDLTEAERDVLVNSTAACISAANHKSRPIFNAVSMLVRKYDKVLDRANVYSILRCLESAYNAGDIDSFCQVWKGGQHLKYTSPEPNPGNMWVMSMLREASYPKLLEMLDLRRTHTDFGRLYDSVFPLTYDRLVIPRAQADDSIPSTRYIQVNDSWSYILITGGASASDLLTSKDSPLPERALRTLDTGAVFKYFLRRMTSRPSDLAYVLNNNKYIRDRFLQFKDDNGENALHVILRHMPHHTSGIKTGRLTLWLDKNAREMFKVPFADGTSVENEIQKIDPLWASRIRRAALAEIASMDQVQRGAAPPRRAM